MKYLSFLIFLAFIGCNSNTNKAKEFFEGGNTQYNNGNLVSAIIWYNKAIELDDKMIEAYWNRATARLAVIDYDGASKDFSKVIELDPQRAGAYLNRGLIKVYKKEFTDEAAADFTKAIELNPKLTDAWYNRGVVKYVMKDLSAACQDWKKSADMGSIKGIQKVKLYCK